MPAPKRTKAEIVESITEKTLVHRKTIHAVVDQLFEAIKAGLLADRVVELRGFGTFEVRTRKGRTQARNPRTGETIPVEDHGVAIFRPGRELKRDSWSLRE